MSWYSAGHVRPGMGPHTLTHWFKHAASTWPTQIPRTTVLEKRALVLRHGHCGRHIHLPYMQAVSRSDGKQQAAFIRREPQPHGCPMPELLVPIYLHLVCMRSRSSGPCEFISCGSVRSGRTIRNVQTLTRCRIGGFSVRGRGNSARLPNLAPAIRNGIDPSTASKVNLIRSPLRQNNLGSTHGISCPVPCPSNPIILHPIYLLYVFATEDTEGRTQHSHITHLSH